MYTSWKIVDTFNKKQHIHQALQSLSSDYCRWYNEQTGTRWPTISCVRMLSQTARGNIYEYIHTHSCELIGQLVYILDLFLQHSSYSEMTPVPTDLAPLWYKCCPCLITKSLPTSITLPWKKRANGLQIHVQGWYQRKICLAMLSTIIKGIQRCQPELNWLTLQKLMPHIRSMNMRSEHSMTGPRGVLTLRLWAREHCDVAWIMSSFLWSWLTYLIRVEALRIDHITLWD